METPPTPTPVHADVEVDVPSGTVSVNLDLNPDLEDEEDNEETVSIENKTYQTPFNTPLNAYNDDSNVAASDGNVSEENTAKELFQDMSVSSWTLPFEEAFELLKSQFSQGAKHQPISLAQQSKFINYMDAQLLQIQRKFIKNQVESVVTYSVAELIQDLSPIIDLLWFLLLDHESLFGQEEYYLKILSDLDDWLSYYTFPSLAVRLDASIAFHIKFFDFCQRLDTHVSFLIDGYDANGNFAKMSTTEVVRLSPVVMRLRLTIVSKLDESRATLSAGRGIAANDEILNMPNVEIGKLFEGILERI